jgi:hypothetical protein
MSKIRTPLFICLFLVNAFFITNIRFDRITDLSSTETNRLFGFQLQESKPTKTPRPTSTPVPIPPPSDPGYLNVIVSLAVVLVVVVVLVVIFVLVIGRRRPD